MIDFCIRIVKDKTGVLLHPRFVVSFLALTASIMLFVVTLVVSLSYQKSVTPKLPEELESRMKYEKGAAMGPGSPVFYDKESNTLEK